MAPVGPQQDQPLTDATSSFSLNEWMTGNGTSSSSPEHPKPGIARHARPPSIEFPTSGSISEIEPLPDTPTPSGRWK